VLDHAADRVDRNAPTRPALGAAAFEVRLVVADDVLVEDGLTRKFDLSRACL
jgi:hypothetical protein